MAEKVAGDLEELLLRLIADAAVLHALLQEADASHFERNRKRLDVLLNVIGGLPSGPVDPRAAGIGFKLKQSEDPDE